MAALIRCSHQLPKNFSGEIIPKFQSFPAKFVSAGFNYPESRRPVFCHVKHEKVIDVLNESLAYDKNQDYPSQDYSRSDLTCFASTIQTEDLGITQTLEEMLKWLCYAITHYYFYCKRAVSFKFLRACTLTNVLLFIVPTKVLAETCEARSSLSEMPLLFGIALIGAAVGGLLARQRKSELEKLNAQLRQINAALRRQAVKESYAPSLSYAPVGRISESEVIVDPRKQDLVSILRSGKNFLRNEEPTKAFEEFKSALELAKTLGDPVEEKKAARGLGGSLRRQGKYKEAIRYYLMILEICKRIGDDSGSTEAYGAIADCYTELGDFERAAKFYDKYIARLETD